MHKKKIQPENLNTSFGRPGNVSEGNIKMELKKIW
jgi:hypothetical protein